MNDSSQMPSQAPTPPTRTTMARKAYVRPSLDCLGALASMTRGPGMGTEDAVIFAPGGDPADDPS